MDNTANPYAAPSHVTVEPGADERPGPSLDFVPILRRWERLRVFYNTVLIILVLSLTIFVFPQHASVPVYWFALTLGAGVANLCFLTGPAIEAYGTYFRIWHKALTLILFLAGLGFTALLATSCVATFQLG